jgi:stearoyl-CoA desaturase (delta-9 desaturase)
MQVKNIFRPSAEMLLLNQYITHGVFIYFLFTCTLNEWLVALSIYFFRVTIGATVTLHRLLSHRSFKAPKWFEYTGSLIGTLGGGISTIGWVAIHREHHRYSDTSKDPHSPLYINPMKIQFRTEIITPSVKYVPDLLRSKFHTTLHQYHWAFTLVFFLIILTVDPRALVFAYFVPNLIYWHSGGLINTVNHTLGYCNHETKDHSVNNLLTGWLVAGEGWHNNHHNAPASPKFGEKWWEFDLGWQVIKLIKQS